MLHAGNIDARRDFTDVRDVVRAYWAILTHTSGHTIFNLCSGHVVAISEIIGIFQKVTGIQVTVQNEASRTQRGDAPLLAGSYARLHEATGWEPKIPLDQTLADVFEYWTGRIGLRG